MARRPLLVSALILAACSGDADEREITIRFSPRVGDAPFACGQDYAGIGSGAATVTPLDFRMYVHDVALVRASGERVPVEVDDDGRWQHAGLVLLDFEDGSGACMTGSPDRNLEIRGRAPAGEYTGVEFTIGVPAADNHLDGATAPAPLNAQGMWWSWAGGYKYVRLDVRPQTQPEFFYHLGATACEGTVPDGFTCAFGNRAQIKLDGFDPDADAIAVDAAAILAGVDVERAPDGMTDNIPGCMAFPGDPECPPMMAPLGLQFESDAPAGAQTVFSVQPRGEG